MKYVAHILAALIASATISQAATIAFEAEDYASVSVSPTFDTEDPAAGASGSKAITASNNAETATATYTLDVTTSAVDYTLYARVFSPSSGDDSFFLPTQLEIDTNTGTASLEINQLSNGNNLTGPTRV